MFSINPGPRLCHGLQQAKAPHLQSQGWCIQPHVVKRERLIPHLRGNVSDVS